MRYIETNIKKKHKNSYVTATKRTHVLTSSPNYLHHLSPLPPPPATPLTGFRRLHFRHREELPASHKAPNPCLLVRSGRGTRVLHISRKSFRPPPQGQLRRRGSRGRVQDQVGARGSCKERGHANGLFYRWRGGAECRG